MRVTSFLVVLGMSPLAWADEPTEPAPPVPPPPTSFEDRLRELEAKNKKLEDQLDALRDDHAFLKQNVDRVMPLTGKVSGYADFGFFAVGGDGSGIRPDLGHRHLPQFGYVPDSWVFMGDPLSTAINARGEPADTGPSRAVVFDSVNSNGKSSFILNAVDLALFAGFGDSLQFNALVDFAPRSRNVSDPNGSFLGDFVDVKLGYMEYRAPIEAMKLSIFAGKFDSTLGIEYRTQESPDRLSVTPSLICRYTCGHPLGVKARAQFLDDKLALAVAVTNGSNFVETFPFYDEIDTNNFKTVSGRLSYKLPIGSGIEVGMSGAFGAQDFQPDDDVYQWHYGFDLHVDWNDVIVAGEFVQGRARGKTEMVPCDLAPCLTYKGAYGLVGYRVNNWLTPYTRVDWRDATHESGASFVYLSKLARATLGVHLELGTQVVLKAEYTLNHELDPIPQFSDDIFTTALVIRY